MVTLRPFIGLLPTDQVLARSVSGACRLRERQARRASHPRHVAWLEAADDETIADVDAWLAEGSLRADPTPVLRLVEQQVVDGHRVVGVLGLARLADLVPHEGTDPAAVERRVHRDARQQVDSRPLLAVLAQDPPTLAELVAPARGRRAELDVTDADGVRHRTWPLTIPEGNQLAAALQPLSCLLADGHHRVAAASARGRRSMPTLLTFASDPPLLDDVWRLARVAEPDQGRVQAWVHGLPTQSSPLELRHHELVRHPRLRDGEHPVEATYRLAHSVPGVARVKSTPHATTRDRALRDGGVVVGSAAPSVPEVLRAVGAGDSLPPKSTAFRPKPRVGLVLHRVEGEAS